MKVVIYNLIHGVTSGKEYSQKIDKEDTSVHRQINGDDRE